MIITNHARERLIERLGCNEKKIEKVVEKAFGSKEKIKKKLITYRKFNGYEDCEFRMFCGCIFCFRRVESGDPILITVLIKGWY